MMTKDSDERKLRMFDKTGRLLKPWSPDDREIVTRWGADFEGEDDAMCSIWNDIVDVLDDSTKDPAHDAIISMLFSLEEAAYIAGYKRGSTDCIEVKKITIETNARASTTKPKTNAARTATRRRPPRL